MDNSLTIGYQACQAGHCVAQWLLDNKDTQTWNNRTLVYLQVDNVERWKQKLDDLEIKNTHFCEPDIDNKMTSIACQVEDTRIFRKLKLLGK